MESWLFILLLTGLLCLAAWSLRSSHAMLRVPARYDSIRALTSTVNHFVRAARLGEREEFEFRLALDEACVNIIEHAYDNDLSGEIAIFVRAVPGMCEIRLTDFGVAYDPRSIMPPQFGIGLGDSRPGGLGLHLMQKMMDEVNYTAGPDGNCLKMVKRRAS